MVDPAQDGWGRETSPYHKGEYELHQRLGLADRQEGFGRRILRPFLPEQHRHFYAQLPMLVVGSIDGSGSPWASMVFGPPGFVSSPHDRRLDVDTRFVAGDPTADNIKAGAPIGVLGIEMPTRRRNRVNGIVSGANPDGFRMDVVQSFGNCPQYIQTREATYEPLRVVHPDAVDVERFTQLDAEAVRLIARSDAFFVASHNDQDDPTDTGGVDVSFRGGRPGFVKVEQNTLTVPDFIGNFAFNTLGNFHLNPVAGLLFIDFESGEMLTLTGAVELIWDKDQDAELSSFRGAERGWRFHLTHGLRIRNANPMQWRFGEYSPNTVLTGTWDEANAAVKAKQHRQAWTAMRVAKTVDETDAVRSFYLKAKDGETLLHDKPGQFITLKVPIGDDGREVSRAYSLSSAPGDGFYRISVKREEEGLLSSHLHRSLTEGSELLVRAANGAFVLDTAETRPAVLLAGGIGITPFVAMARQNLIDATRLRRIRPMTIVHVERFASQRGFHKELQSLAKASGGAIRYVSVVTGEEEDMASTGTYDFAGRLNKSMLQSILPHGDYSAFLCGPAGFMQSAYDLMREVGTSDDDLFAESFGPSSLTRDTLPAGQPSSSSGLSEAHKARVEFTFSDVEAEWKNDEDETLLDLAEKHGLSPPFACRNGACGTCVAKVTHGQYVYRTAPTFTPENSDEVLICCAVPADACETLTLEM